MRPIVEIMVMETSDRVKNTYTPYVQFRSNGNSYFNAKAAKLLGLNHLDFVRLYRNSETNQWFIGKVEGSGTLVRKNGGLYKFCDTPIIRRLFNSYGIDGAKRVDFYTSTSLQTVPTIDGEMEVLFLNPKYYNLK